jgi:hypothetical protein
MVRCENHEKKYKQGVKAMKKNKQGVKTMKKKPSKV